MAAGASPVVKWRDSAAPPTMVLDSTSAPELLSFFGTESSFIADSTTNANTRRNSFQDEVARTLAALQESRLSPQPSEASVRRRRRQPGENSASPTKQLNQSSSVNITTNDYDREGTPCGSHHAPLTVWSKWRVKEAHPESGQVVMAAATFDPPWRAPEDRQGAPINAHPGYHHSAVGSHSPERMRADRQERRVAKDSGAEQLLGALEPRSKSELAVVGAMMGASQRGNFMKMNFQNRPFGKVQTIHSSVADYSPAELRESRRRREALPADQRLVDGAGPRHANQVAAASQRFNTFNYESKSGEPWYSPHPGHIGVPVGMHRLSPDELRAQRVRSRDPQQRRKERRLHQPRRQDPGASTRRRYLNC